MFYNLQDKSIKEIKKSIKELQALDMRTTSYDYYFDKLISAVSGYTTDRILTGYNINIQKDKPEYYGIFRARKIKDELYENVRDIWAKDSNNVNCPGRCNNIGESKLYCANHLITTLIECRAMPGDDFVIMEYQYKKDTLIEGVGLGTDPRKFLEPKDRPQGLPEYIQKMDEQMRKKHGIVDKFLKQSFKQIIPPDRTHEYLKTVAIVDFFTKNDAVKDKPFFVLYPSIATDGKGVNMLYEPRFARAFLEEVKAYFVTVKKIDLNVSKADISVRANGKIIGERIEWRQA